MIVEAQCVVKTRYLSLPIAIGAFMSTNNALEALSLYPVPTSYTILAEIALASLILTFHAIIILKIWSNSPTNDYLEIIEVPYLKWQVQ